MTKPKGARVTAKAKWEQTVNDRIVDLLAKCLKMRGDLIQLQMSLKWVWVGLSALVVAVASLLLLEIARLWLS
jgi:hypothetical protein